MDRELSNLSGGLMLRGVFAIIFGVAASFWPHITLVTLVYLFSAFVLASGLVDVVVGIGRLVGNGQQSILTRILTLLFGVLEIGVGVYLLRHPAVSFATLILLIGFTLIIRGVFEIVAGLFEDGPGTYRTMMVIVGLLAALAGIIVLFQPAASGVAFVWILGIYSLVTGPLLIAGALEVNNLAKDASATRKRVA
jgi:uncharacterized membrane protein HdeD (DUF308 family)